LCSIFITSFTELLLSFGFLFLAPAMSLNLIAIKFTGPKYCQILRIFRLLSIFEYGFHFVTVGIYKTILIVMIFEQVLENFKDRIVNCYPETLPQCKLFYFLADSLPIAVKIFDTRLKKCPSIAGLRSKPHESKVTNLGRKWQT